MQKLVILAILFFAANVWADTIYLKNGGSLEGIIEREDKDKVEINMGFGSATMEKRQIKNIERSRPKDNDEMIKKWAEKKKDLDAKVKEFEEAREKRFDGAQDNWVDEARLKKINAEKETKYIRISRDERTKSIVVETLLNERVKANLVLDTGASLVILSRRIGEELGIDVTDKKSGMMEFRLADGSRTRAKTIILDSVRIQDVEVDKVMAAVMVEQVNDPALKDGLLGMSFLNRFNFKMDMKGMKIMLEKIDEPGK